MYIPSSFREERIEQLHAAHVEMPMREHAQIGLRYDVLLKPLD